MGAWLGKTSLAIFYVLDVLSLKFVQIWWGVDTGEWSFACVILSLTNYKARTKPIVYGMKKVIHLSIFSALLFLSYINMQVKGVLSVDFY